MPRARLADAGGGTREWRSSALPRRARMTRRVEALIAGAHLAGTNTRRVKRALGALFRGAVGKDVVSRTWRKVKADWDAWNRRDLAAEGVVRLVLDGTVVRVRLDRKATNVSLLVVLGVRRDGQKVLLAVENMGGESEAAWRGVLEALGRGRGNLGDSGDRHGSFPLGAVAEVVESGGGVVSGLSQRARPAFERRRRPRHGAG